MDEDRKIDDVEGSWAHTFSPLDLEAAGVRRTFSYLFGFLVFCQISGCFPRIPNSST